MTKDDLLSYQQREQLEQNHYHKQMSSLLPLFLQTHHQIYTMRQCTQQNQAMPLKALYLLLVTISKRENLVLNQ